MQRKLFSGAILTIMLPVWAESGVPLLDVSKARPLVLAALPEETLRLPGLAVVPGPVKKERCVILDVMWANPGVGSAHVNFYTVDRRTGAIWRGVTGIRSLVSNPALRVLQKDIRKGLGTPEDEYQKAVKEHRCGY